jgi:hypothetical protein
MPIIAERICRDGSCLEKFWKLAPLWADTPIEEAFPASFGQTSAARLNFSKRYAWM